MTTKGRHVDDKDLENVSGGANIEDEKITKPTVVTVRPENTGSISNEEA